MSEVLSSELYKDDILMEPTRKGFGEGLLEAAKNDESIVALSADLLESTQVEPFAKEFPNRFIEMGVAEQNLVTVASGMAAIGKKPFVTSYASFSPGRNWEQIRTTICLNDRPVVVVGCHSGVSVGPDGATHQMLEDIALMRSLPNMQVIVPCDSVEAKKATETLARLDKPSYLRLTREKTPVMTTDNTEFEIGKATIFKQGSDVSLVACGPVIYEALRAAKELENKNISVEVINSSSIKPLDVDTILSSAKKTNLLITLEEAQVAGGLGGAVTEALSTIYPVKIIRLGIQDRFGQSGTISELWKEYGIDSESIEKSIIKALKGK